MSSIAAGNGRKREPWLVALPRSASPTRATKTTPVSAESHVNQDQSNFLAIEVARLDRRLIRGAS